MYRYHYTGEATVFNFAGEWSTGDERDTVEPINHPDFDRIIVDVVLDPDLSLQQALESPSSTKEVTSNG